MSEHIIHVNRHHIAANTKDGRRRPIYTIKSKGQGTRYARQVDIDGPSRLIYSPDKPLSCGARAWIETDAGLTLTDEMSYQEAKLCS